MTENELRKIFNGKNEYIDPKGKQKEGFINTTFENFNQWFLTSNFQRGFHYCGTTNERTLELYNA